MSTTTSTQYESTKARLKRHEIFWLEQSGEAVPSDDSWLSEREQNVLARLRFSKRRADWRLGRWTAKCAVSRCLGLPVNEQSLRGIEICAAPDGAPEVHVGDEHEPIALSLSHREGTAICAVSMRDTSIGCDLELIEPRSAVFISDYLTAEEQELIRDAPDDQKSVLVNLIWSAKESVLKAKRVGLRSSTLSLTVVALEGAFNSRRQHGTTWSALAVQDELDTLYRGWWQSEHLLVRTIVTRPSSTEPIYLK